MICIFHNRIHRFLRPQIFIFFQFWFCNFHSEGIRLLRPYIDIFTLHVSFPKNKYIKVQNRVALNMNQKNTVVVAVLLFAIVAVILFPKTTSKASTKDTTTHEEKHE
jgi:hypothetical protein